MERNNMKEVKEALDLLAQLKNHQETVKFFEKLGHVAATSSKIKKTIALALNVERKLEMYPEDILVEPKVREAKKEVYPLKVQPPVYFEAEARGVHLKGYFKFGGIRQRHLWDEWMGCDGSEYAETVTPSMYDGHYPSVDGGRARLKLRVREDGVKVLDGDQEFETDNQMTALMIACNSGGTQHWFREGLSLKEWREKIVKD